ncbi:hypothetical protein CEXT_752591 [Caerostris extrusa]|uniref:Uncharacterized protein n=1 Tax=Caerostris extrusa TaxID=172846 RepID=A0AAV4S5C8_CAEEX|nr:hypothetical protein CEXT_752591 [Caerostris extrusa]
MAAEGREGTNTRTSKRSRATGGKKRLYTSIPPTHTFALSQKCYRSLSPVCGSYFTRKFVPVKGERTPKELSDKFRSLLAVLKCCSWHK